MLSFQQLEEKEKQAEFLLFDKILKKANSTYQPFPCIVIWRIGCLSGVEDSQRNQPKPPKAAKPRARSGEATPQKRSAPKAEGAPTAAQPRAEAEGRPKSQRGRAALGKKCYQKKK